MNRYPAYKDSGIEWIDKVPLNWQVKKLKQLGVFTSSGIDKKTIEGEVTVKMVNYTDIYGNQHCELNNDRNYMSVSCPHEKKKVHQLEKGDLVFTPSSETVEDIGLSALINENLQDTVYSYHVIRLRFNKPVSHRYKKYLCNNNFVLNQFSKCAKGTTRQILGRDDFKNIQVVLPPDDEQQSASIHLDKRIDQIDNLVAKKEKIIEILKEERTAIINQVVTKGLDPKVETKDSGIVWLGKVPKHWGIKKLQYLGRFQNGISESSEYFGSGYPFISYGDVYNNMTLPDKIAGLAQSSDEERRRMSVKEGDVFFTRTSETIEEIGISSVCMQSVKDAVFSGFLIRFRPSTQLLTKEFSKYYFRSIVTRKFFVKEMNIVTRASLAQDLLKKLPVLLPSFSEQKEIFEYLKNKSNQIDRQMLREQKLIKLLKEYRTALISEVVTGKIDVRECVT
ncbi:MAG: restriction endonuclease subunit S [Candidatus Omnitrophica bacterium]|nr:restriction endonuclease subunit S [Candidatus Omnitrophota bacterium]